MAIDFDKLRNKLEQLNNPGAKRNGGNTWRPLKEPVKVRLIEYPYEDDPFVERYFHYGVGSGPGFLCPRKNLGKPCPVCDFGNELYNSSDDQDKELAKSLWAKPRYHAVVVDRTDAESKPKFWQFGPTVYKKLIQTLLNTDYSHMMDVNSGVDLSVYQEKKTGKLYPDTDYTPDRKDTPLAETEEEINKIISSVVQLEEVYATLTLSEIKERLKNWLDSRDDASSVSVSSGETTKQPKKSESSIDEEFEKALASA